MTLPFPIPSYSALLFLCMPCLQMINLHCLRRYNIRYVDDTTFPGVPSQLPIQTGVSAPTAAGGGGSGSLCGPLLQKKNILTALPRLHLVHGLSLL